MADRGDVRVVVNILDDSAGPKPLIVRSNAGIPPAVYRQVDQRLSKVDTISFRQFALFRRAFDAPEIGRLFQKFH